MTFERVWRSRWVYVREVDCTLYRTSLRACWNCVLICGEAIFTKGIVTYGIDCLFWRRSPDLLPMCYLALNSVNREMKEAIVWVLLRTSQRRSRRVRKHKKETSCWAFSETSPAALRYIFTCNFWKRSYIRRFFAYALNDVRMGAAFLKKEILHLRSRRRLRGRRSIEMTLRFVPGLVDVTLG